MSMDNTVHAVRASSRALGWLRDGPAKIVIVACLAFGFAARMRIALRPVEVLVHRYLADDYFYYLSVAFHVARGEGSTFDGGISRTNGYNPLLMWMLAMMFRLGASKTAAIHLGLAVEAVSVMATAWFAANQCRRQGAPLGALLVAGSLSIAPFFIWPTVNGFETPLAAATALFTLELWDLEAATQWVGLASGVAFLARADAIALVFVLLVACARRQEWRSAMKLGAGFAAVALPFCLWSAYEFGLLLPGSAIAKSHVRSLASVGNSLRVFLLTLPNTLVTPRILDRAASPLACAIVFAVALLCLAGLRRLQFVRSALLGCIVFSYAVLADGFEAGALRRYLFLAWVLSLSAAAVAIDGVQWPPWGAQRNIPKPRVVTIALVSVILLVHVSDCARLLIWDRATKPIASYVGVCGDLATILDRRLAASDRIGSFDSGSLGYFAPRPVVNLDGLVNDDVIRLKRTCRADRYATCLLGYMREKGISVFVGGTAFGWTAIFPDWESWPHVFDSPVLADGSRVVVLRVPQSGGESTLFPEVGP